MLDSIMRHHELFVISTLAGGDPMSQGFPPTEIDLLAASGMMEIFRNRLAE